MTGDWNLAYDRTVDNGSNALYFWNNSGSYYTTGEVNTLLSAFLSDMTYKGVRDASTTAYPTEVGTGDFYVISIMCSMD